MNETTPFLRKIVARLSIFAGNTIQIVGLALAWVCLASARSSHSKTVASLMMLAAWLLLYFFCHGIAHWLVGRLVGIRFAFYTIGGTGNPQAYPPGLRWVFEHLPFFGVQTEKASMLSASPTAKAIMWSAGVTSSALVPTLGAVCAWREGVPASKPFLIFATIWALATLASNWTSRSGDFSKARRVLAGQ
ncbi:MAG TPA: hypothetical protein VNW47_17150 [Terriglobales bacterium]|jgi:hypothetical protein|nr:hypothetical protein [Terriglobales bacterium]